MERDEMERNESEGNGIKLSETVPTRYKNIIVVVVHITTYRLHRVISGILKLLDIVDGNSVLLKRFKGLVRGTALLRI